MNFYRKIAELKELLEYQKSKTDWYIKEAAEYRNKLRYSVAREQTLKDRIARVRKEAREYVNHVKSKFEKYVKDNKELRRRLKESYEAKSEAIAETKRVRAEMEAMKQKLSVLHEQWTWAEATPAKQEITLRSIIGYETLKRKGYADYSEILLLILGSQRVTFSPQDIKERIGDYVFHYMSGFRVFMDAGLFAKIERRQLYYITDAGKTRLEALMKHIFTVKIGTHKEIQEIISKK